MLKIFQPVPLLKISPNISGRVSWLSQGRFRNHISLNMPIIFFVEFENISDIIFNDNKDNDRIIYRKTTRI